MAADKKHNERFCLQFKAVDPKEKQVAQILNTMVRGEKTAFITEAILHYINCPETVKAELLLPTPKEAVYVISESQLESVIKTVVNRMERLSTENPFLKPHTSESTSARDASILNAASIFNF